MVSLRLPLISTWELIQEERERFEIAAATRLGERVSAIKKQRVEEGYGDRMYLNIAWYYWLLAVGLLQPAADLPGNEHAIVNSRGELLGQELNI